MRRTYNTISGRERWTMTQREREDLTDAVATVLNGAVLSLDTCELERYTQLWHALLEAE